MAEEDELRDELREIAVPAEAKCAICQATRKRHRQLEDAGELHHHFSVGGELRQSVPQKKPPRVVSTPDLVLRMALVDKGLITTEDLLRAELKLRESSSVPDRPGSGDTGDRPDRSGPTPE